jgi:hypothetical protein
MARLPALLYSFSVLLLMCSVPVSPTGHDP